MSATSTIPLYMCVWRTSCIPGVEMLAAEMEGETRGFRFNSSPVHILSYLHFQDLFYYRFLQSFVSLTFSYPLLLAYLS